MEMERREDVFSEVAKKFPMREFKKFAKSEIGLVLDHNDVVSIIASNNYESDEEQKIQILYHWAEKNGTRATNEKLRQLVTDYFKMEESYVPGERLEDVFQKIVERFANIEQFKRFARSKRGLSLDGSKVRSIDEANSSSGDKCIEMLLAWKLKTDFFEESNLSAKIKKLVDDYFSEEEFMPEGAEGSSQASTSQQRQSQESNDDTRKKSSTRDNDETGQDGPSHGDSDEKEIKQSPQGKKNNAQKSEQKTSSGGLFGIFRARQHVSKFQKTVCKRAWKQSIGRVTETYKEQKLTEPTFEVYPKIKRITRFYHGEMAPKQTEYRKEAGFSALQEHVTEGVGVSLQELIETFNDETVRHIELVGQAGSGKTTMMDRMVRDVISSSGLTSKWYSPTGLFKKFFKNRFKLVYFVNIRDLVDSDAISAQDLLFGNVITDLDGNTIVDGYQWVIDNQEDVIFFFDGLDQAPWTLQECHQKIKHGEKASTATVMSNVISGHLFPRVKIVMSSREHCIAPLTGKLRPDLIYALTGLSPDDAKDLFVALLGDIGQQQWDKTSSSAPLLIPLFSVPVFLMFNAIVQAYDLDNTPDTMTGVMLHILQILIESEHIREKIKIAEILHQLQKIAFTGTSEKRVVFESKELKDNGIDTETIRDIVIKVPGNSMFRQNLLDGQYRFFFSHQTIQEILAALYVCEMNLPEFEDFVHNSLHRDHWSVVRRFVCGNLLNDTLAKDEFGQLLKIDQKNEKRDILRRSMDEKLKQTQDSFSLMEMFASLYEANDADLIKDHVKVINFETTTINPSGMLAIASVMRRSEKLDLVRFSRCNLDSESIGILGKNVNNTQLKISSFEFTQTEVEISRDGMKELSSLLQSFAAVSVNIHCYCSYDALLAFADTYKRGTINNFTWKPSSMISAEVFIDISAFVESHVDKFVTNNQKSFDEDDIGILSRSKGSKKLKKLNVERNRSLGVQGVSQLASVVLQCEVEDVIMNRCELTAEAMERFKNNTRGAKLKKLDVRGNRELGVKGVSQVASVVLQCEVEDVNMILCGLTAEAINGFKNNTRGAKLKKLDVGENRKFGVQGVSQLASVVLQCEVEDVNMSWCELTAEAMEGFKNNTRGAKLKKLDVWGNRSLGVEGVSQAASVVLQCELEDVNMGYCKLTAEAMEGFKNNTRGAKLKKLDVWGNESLGVEGVSHLASVVLQCEVEDVNMSDCGLTAEAMEGFKNNTRGAKLKKLDVEGNSTLGVQGVSQLASVVLQCEVEDVNMGYCGLTAEAMEVFKNNTRGAKINRLSLSDTCFITWKNEEISTITEIVRQCQVKTLVVDTDNFKDSMLERFKKVIAEAGADLELE
uniref:uncharacterized protein LOC120326636 n=1 Tax=Styela clava TaxID=7725 RepID=UPI00193A1B2D|nr:uncharacterized protein LOC120326636 [Styela clava]